MPSESALTSFLMSALAVAVVIWVICDLIATRRRFHAWAHQDEVFQRILESQLSGYSLAPETEGRASADVRREEALEVIRRCAHDRQGEVAGETTTYEEAFRKLEVAAAALRFIEGHAEDALR